MSNDYQSLWQAVQAQWHDVIITVFVSMISGSAAYMNKLSKNKPRMFSLVEFVADNLAAGLAGFIALMVCLELKVSPWFTGAVVGIVGHSATRFLFLTDKWLMNKVKSQIVLNEKEKKDEEIKF